MSTGREAAIARRRAIASGGKTQSANPGRSRAAPTPAPRERSVAAQAPSAPKPAPASAALPRSGSRSAGNAGRDRAMARRERMTQGKNALRSASPAPARSSSALQGLSGRDAAIARRQQITGGKEAAPAAATGEVSTKKTGSCECGCRNKDTAQNTAPASAGASSARARPRPKVKTVNQNHGRTMSMARRAAMANRGKAGVEALSGRSGSSAAATLMRNSGASSREIARKVREERCERGKVCDTSTSRPTGRARRGSSAKSSSPSKVGASETAAGQAVTGTLVGRSIKTTGDESGSCRQVTGTEYLGAELFQEFCGITPAPVQRPAPASTPKGKTVTGNQVGRSSRVTGDEVGASRQLTGTPYTQPGEEGKAPRKVGTTETFSGRGVTGTLVGRSGRVTGDESGTCKRVTGNEYVGFEQYQSFCNATPEPFGAKKVGVDATWHGQQVTGTRTGRSQRVTGDEPGTCEVVTGTPYTSPADYKAFCEPEETREAALHTPSRRGTPGASLTGLQPGIGGVMTGDEKGACATLTGTPYVGQDQFFSECGEGSDATPGSADFPQPLSGGNWSAFSIQSPARAAQATRSSGQITGTTYGQEEGRITGPFNMGRGMVTGTEGFRSRQSGQAPVLPTGMNPVPAAMPPSAPPAPAPAAGSEPARPRITGEGMDGGARITGDDWGRNERVTGTEGFSSAGRNPTRRGGVVGPFAGARAYRESQARQTPELQITGGSGNTDRGALVTVSGGARG